MYMDMGMGMGGGVGVWRMVGRGRKEKDLMVGQISFYVFCCCVVRMDGFVQSWMVELGRRHIELMMHQSIGIACAIFLVQYVQFFLDSILNVIVDYIFRQDAFVSFARLKKERIIF